MARPVSPVIPGKENKEIKVAKYQKEYQTLPSLKLKNGNVNLSRWELSNEDLLEIIETKSVYLYQVTFNKPVTPVFISPYENEDIQVEGICNIEHNTLNFGQFCPECQEQRIFLD